MTPKPCNFNLSDKPTRDWVRDGLSSIGDWQSVSGEYPELVPQMWAEVHRVFPDLRLGDPDALVTFTEGFWLGTNLHQNWQGPLPTFAAAVMFVLDILKAVDELETGLPR